MRIKLGLERLDEVTKHGVKLWSTLCSLSINLLFAKLEEMTETVDESTQK